MAIPARNRLADDSDAGAAAKRLRQRAGHGRLAGQRQRRRRRLERPAEQARGGRLPAARRAAIFDRHAQRQELAVEVGRLLSQRVRKITIVDPREVAEWTDENDWDDFTEVGKALKADMVVGIDVEEFSLYQSQTLYQGKARLAITVYDVADGGKTAYSKTIPRIIYPPNRGVDTSMPEDDFRRRFVAHLADMVGRHFYSHDAQADVALDAKGFQDE